MVRNRLVLLYLLITDFEVSRFDIEDFIADFVEENFYVVLEDESQKFVYKE